MMTKSPCCECKAPGRCRGIRDLASRQPNPSGPTAALQEKCGDQGQGRKARFRHDGSDELELPDPDAVTGRSRATEVVVGDVDPNRVGLEGAAKREGDSIADGIVTERLADRRAGRIRSTTVSGKFDGELADALVLVSPVGVMSTAAEAGRADAARRTMNGRTGFMAGRSC